MPLSPNAAYDRAARKIWRAFLVSMLVPLPLILFQAWLRHTDRIALYLLLGMAVIWGAAALPLFLSQVRSGFRARTILIAKASDLFCCPLLVSLRFPTDIIKDCGGSAALQFGTFGAIGALWLLLWLWFRSVNKEYQAALPPDASAPTREPPLAQEIQPARSDSSVI